MNSSEILLVKALRSKKYEQTQSYLRDMDGFCCLGVACDIYNHDLWNNEKEFPEYVYLDELFALPLVVLYFLNWKTENGVLDITDREGGIFTLAGLNDDGFTFEQIADIIEANLVTKERDNE